jgi:hypothetical protein
MIFGLVLLSNEHYPELCLVADKPSLYSKPVPVRLLTETLSGAHLVSNEEGVLVSFDHQDRGMVLEPMRPAKLYLTPNLPEKPGYSVDKIKLIEVSEGKYQVYYDRTGKGWEEWHPNRKTY